MDGPIRSPVSRYPVIRGKRKKNAILPPVRARTKTVAKVRMGLIETCSQLPHSGCPYIKYHVYKKAQKMHAYRLLEPSAHGLILVPLGITHPIFIHLKAFPEILVWRV